MPSFFKIISQKYSEEYEKIWPQKLLWTHKKGDKSNFICWYKLEIPETIQNYTQIKSQTIATTAIEKIFKIVFDT